MEEHELHHLAVPKNGDGSRRGGMNWHLLPISDGKVPDASFEKTWSYAGCRLRSLLSEGRESSCTAKAGLAGPVHLG